VNLFLRRIHSHQQGLFASWFGLFFGIALVVFAFTNFQAFVAGAWLVVYGLGTSWAVWWVEKYDRWD
jgi:hypothetical protein